MTRAIARRPEATLTGCHTRAMSQNRSIVIIAGAPYHGVRRGARGLADGLVGSADLLYVDPPISPLTGSAHDTGRATLLRSQVVEESPGLHRLAPVAPPGKSRAVVHRATRRMLIGALRNALSAIGMVPTVVIQQSPHFPVLGALGEPISVYRASDSLAVGAGLVGGSARRIAAAEARVAAKADIIVAVSETLAGLWRDRGRRVVVIRNGVDAEAFAEVETAMAAPGIDLPPPVAGVVGTLSERLDLRLLQGLADSGQSLLLVGPDRFRKERAEFQALVERPTVHWAGQQPFPELPRFYRHIDVGLIPYTSSRFNQASDPLKTLEYFAAGKPAVSTDLPAAAEFDLPDLQIAPDSERFLAAIAQAAMISADPESRARRRAIVAEHTWDKRAAQLLEILEI